MTSRIEHRIAAGILAALLLLSAAPAVGAQSAENLELDALVELYNANLDDAPGIATDELAGKTIELRVGPGSTVATATSGDVYYVITNPDGVITDYGVGDGDSPTVRVLTSEAAIEGILESEDPAAAFDDAYENGEIKITGLTLTDSLRIELVKFAVWLGTLFGVR